MTSNIDLLKRFPDFKEEENILIGEDFPPSTDYDNFGKILLNELKDDPDFVGQIDATSDKKTTFAEMRKNSVKCAIWLKQQGVTPIDIIAVSTEHHIHAYIPCLAALYNGIPLNMWDHKMNHHAFRYCLSLIKPKVVFADNAAVEMIKLCLQDTEPAFQLVTFDEIEGYDMSIEKIIDAEFSAEDIANFDCWEIQDPRHTAMLLFSSATLGAPRAVDLSHNTSIDLHKVFLPLFENVQTIVCFTPLFWITCMLTMFNAIICRVTRILPTTIDVEQLYQIVEKHEVSWIMIKISILNALLNSLTPDKYNSWKPLKRIFVGGSKVPTKTQELMETLMPNTELIQYYGLAEVGLISCQKNRKVSPSSGTVCRNIRLKVVDIFTKRTLSQYEHGEICVKTTTFLTRYFRDIITLKNMMDSDGWFHTKDYGYFDETGEIFTLDKMHELLRFKGHYVSPTEMEVVLESHPEVMRAAVSSFQYEDHDEQLVAFVQTKPEAEVTKEELTNLIAVNFKTIALNGGIKFVDEIPLTMTSNVKRIEIKRMAIKYAKEMYEQSSSD